MLSNYFTQETHWSSRKKVPLEFGTIVSLIFFFFKRKTDHILLNTNTPKLFTIKKWHQCVTSQHKLILEYFFIFTWNYFFKQTTFFLCFFFESSFCSCCSSKPILNLSFYKHRTLKTIRLMMKPQLNSQKHQRNTFYSNLSSVHWNSIKYR